MPRGDAGPHLSVGPHRGADELFALRERNLDLDAMTIQVE
jgi:hypothetical protein